MRASNTSSEFVLTYRRTNINQEKTFFSTKEDIFFQFWFNLDFFYETCMFLSTSLCIFFASLFVGWGARLLSVWIQPLQRTPGSANICIRQKRPLSFCLKMLTVMAKCYVFLCVCVCNYAYLSASSMGVAYRDRETERRPEIWLDASLLIKALPNVPPSQSCLCLTL